jgi:hypothetical protein
MNGKDMNTLLGKAITRGGTFLVSHQLKNQESIEHIQPEKIGI